MIIKNCLFLPNDVLFWNIFSFCKSSEIFAFSSLNKKVRKIIINNDNYWQKKIKKISNGMKPFYYFLYGYRFIGFGSKSNINNYIINSDCYYKDINNSVTIFDGIQKINPYLVSFSSLIKLSGHYKIVWIISVNKSSFLTDLHIITKKSLSNNPDLSKSRGETASKLIDNNHYQLKLLNYNKDYVYNIFNILDQHKIREKGWIKLESSSLHLNENTYFETYVTSTVYRFSKYKFKGIYLIKL